jgi:hypothetical protein
MQCSEEGKRIVLRGKVKPCFSNLIPDSSPSLQMVNSTDVQIRLLLPL